MNNSKPVISLLIALMLLATAVVSVAASAPVQAVTTVTPVPGTTDCTAGGGGTTTVTDTVTPTGGGDQTQPVAEALCNYFSGKLPGTDYAAIMTLHDAGFGFGEIAQACFIALKLGGDVACSDILTAKQTGDYSSLTLPGGATVSNWGQLKKLVFGHAHGNNLGAVVGQGEGVHGNGNQGNNGNGNGHGHGGGKGH